MNFFIDTADIRAIRDLSDTGLLDGVTTIPSLIAKSGRNLLEVIAEICAVNSGGCLCRARSVRCRGHDRGGDKACRNRRQCCD